MSVVLDTGHTETVARLFRVLYMLNPSHNTQPLHSQSYLNNLNITNKILQTCDFMFVGQFVCFLPFQFNYSV